MPLASARASRDARPMVPLWRPRRLFNCRATPRPQGADSALTNAPMQVPCYLPNEQLIMMETVEHIMTKLE